ncbi:hypothetical protein K2P47_01645 [Patescibacteria group bacterium]|nr:hypothetical protein [Patescibacteria group bacterium]
MEVPFTFNGRDYVAIATKNQGVEVRYGCITLPSEAHPEIFIQARQVLKLPAAEVIEFH